MLLFSRRISTIKQIPVTFPKSYSNISCRMRGKPKNRQKYDDIDFILEGKSASVSSTNSYYLDHYSDSESGKIPKPVFLKARNERQQHYMDTLENPDKSIIISVGPAGTGKTMMPCHLGIRKLQNDEINKLIITRPAVSVEEQHGFLPGSLEQKMEPWLRPVLDVFYQYYTPQKIQKLIQQQIIEISPLAYMRGRTFENSWIIADESQNMTPNQMLMLLTRIGQNSKMVITGDIKQHDRGFEQNGLKDLLIRLEGKNIPDIDVITFTIKDVERHKVIQEILKLYP